MLGPGRCIVDECLYLSVFLRVSCRDCGEDLEWGRLYNDEDEDWDI